MAELYQNEKYILGASNTSILNHKLHFTVQCLTMQLHFFSVYYMTCLVYLIMIICEFSIYGLMCCVAFDMLLIEINLRFSFPLAGAFLQSSAGRRCWVWSVTPAATAWLAHCLNTAGWRDHEMDRDGGWGWNTISPSSFPSSGSAIEAPEARSQRCILERRSPSSN